MPASRDVIFRLLGEDLTSPAFNKAAASAEGAAARISRSGEKIGAAGRKLTHTVTLPVLALGVAAIKTATDFNSSMTRIQTQAGASARDVQYLSKQVLAMRNVQQGPNELAGALYHLKSVGMDNAHAMRALRVGSDLAAVGHANLEETVNALAGAWRTGIRGAKDFHQAAATVNAVIGAGNMTLEDFTAALGTGILPSAKTFGLTLKDVGSALALFTDEGVPADAAATRLRMTFSLLGAPSKAAEKQLKSIGLTGLTLANDMRKPNGLIRAVGDLKAHLEDPKYKLTLSEQAALLSRAFGGGRSSSAILSMINNFDVLKQKQDQVTRSLGKYDQAVRAQRQTPEAVFKQRLANLERTATTVGTKLLPFAVEAVQTLGKVVGSVADDFDHLSSGQKRLVIEAGLAVVALGPVLRVFGGLTKLGVGVYRASVRVQSAFAGTATAATTSSAAVTRAQVAQTRAVVTNADRQMVALAELRATMAAPLGRFGSGPSMPLGGAGGPAAGAAGGRFGFLRRPGFGMGAGLLGGMGLTYAGTQVGGKSGQVLTNTGTGALFGSFFGAKGALAGAALGASYTGTLDLLNEMSGRNDEQKRADARSAAAARRLANITALTSATVPAKSAFTSSLLDHGRRVGDETRAIAAAAIAREKLTKASAYAGLTEKDLVNAVTGSQTAFMRVNTLMRNTKHITLEQANALGALRWAFLNSGRAATAHALAEGRSLESFKKSGRFAGLLTGKLVDLNRAHLASRVAAHSFSASLGQLSAAVGENGRTLDKNSLFGQRNRVALLSAAAGALRHAQAVYDQTGSLKKAGAALEDDRARLIRVAKAAGLNKSQVDALVTSLGLVSKAKPHAKITVDTRTAEHDLNRVITRMSQIGSGVTGYVNIITTGPGGYRHTVKAQAGGTKAAFGRGTIPPNTAFTVGEGGSPWSWEGGMTDSLGRASIYSNAQSRAMGFKVPTPYARGTGRGAGVVVRVFIGDREITDIVRTEVDEQLSFDAGRARAHA